ncbi:MAG: PDZ domain-containing protein, partial [Oscillospiraceae bacterium]
DINNLPTGVMIVNIETTSDLANTKATQGDIITHIDGVRVEDFDQISDCLAGKKAGDVIKISLFRPLSQTGGQSFDVSCKLMPDVEKSNFVTQ